MSAIIFLLASGLASAPSGADRLSSIDVPHQAIPAYMIYTQCVADHVAGDSRADSADSAEVRRANGDAIAACRAVRAEQLARALSAQTDVRVYGSAEDARAAVRRAFDRFDVDYLIERAGASNIKAKGQ